MVFLICWAHPYLQDSPEVLFMVGTAYADIGSLPPVGLHPGYRGPVPLGVLTCLGSGECAPLYPL